MATRKSKPKDLDAVTQYALDVTEGRIIAGPGVRASCERHLRDLEQAPARGFVFDRERAERVFRFFAQVLKLNGGEWEGVPYELLPWQRFVVGSLFGWVNAQTGYRRFKMAYIETGKGSGKSPMVAGIGLYGMVADGEPRAEIYAAASKKDQAMILFRDAVAMVDQSPKLRTALKKSGRGTQVWNLYHERSASFFRPISSDDGQSGPRPHIGILDEVHEHKDNNTVEMVRAGIKGRRNPLILMITNAGADKTSMAYEYHDYGIKVAQGSLDDDTFFSYVCGLDKDDDWRNDEDCWHKANPSLGITIRHDYIREQVKQAIGMPSKESVVRRLNMCEWVGAVDPWLSSEHWFRCYDEDFDVESLRGRACYAGLDLASTTDLCALVFAFEPTARDPRVRLLPYFWLPGDGLKDKEDKDRVPYLAWKSAGHLLTTESAAVDRKAVVRKYMQEAAKYKIRGIVYDRWRIEDFKNELEEQGYHCTLDIEKAISSVKMIPHGQGFRDMAPAIDRFERLLIDRVLAHTGHPVLNWNAANAVTVTDPAGNRKLTKEKATGRIDGIVAAVMAVNFAGASVGRKRSAGIIALG